MGHGQRHAVTRGLRAPLLALLLVSAAPLGAQTALSAIVVEGNARIETPTILSLAGLARGQAVTPGDVNAAVQAVRASGLFETVDAELRGGTLVIRVAEWPTINRINFEGNRSLSDEELAPLVGSVERRVYSPTQAEEDTAAIAQAYVDAGRINAVVVPSIIRRDDNRVDLVFTVDEGGTTEVERIGFVGNRSFGERRLRGILGTRQAGLLRAVIGSDTFVAERIGFDRQVLTDFYRSRGYADFTINSVDVNLTRERDAYLVTFDVTEGQRFDFGAVTVTSELPEADAEAFRRVVRARAGQTWSPVAIEGDVARMEALATRLGINFLRVDPRITRDPAGGVLDVEYALVRGDRIFVERIDIEGNATTLDRVIRSQFTTVEGDPFNPRAIRESAERIRALGYFADAQVDAREGSSPDQVVIDVNVEEQPTGSLSFGANYSSENGPGLVASFAERNFLGRGQELSFEVALGRDNRNLSLDFAEPRFLGRDLRFGLEFTYRTTDNASALYDTERFRLSPSLQFPVGERSRLTLSYAAEYTDITDVFGFPSDAPEARASLIIFDEAAQGGLWSQALGYQLTWDTRRSNIDTPTNFLLRLGQEVAFGDQLSLRSTALASAETRVLGEGVTLRATVEGGYLSYWEGESRVTDRFFLGSRIMRGFQRGGVGPRDAETDDALGGNAYAVARLETEFPLGLPQEYGISGGAFVDYGSVWDVGKDVEGATILYDDFTPRAVAGLSVFWDTPIGPLRFNFTRPLLVEEFDQPESFDVTVQTRF